MKYLYTLLALGLFVSGCSFKNYKHEAAKIIIIKTPKLKFSDLGYIRHNDDDVELELFFAGKSIKKIAINHLICVDKGCLLKSNFNAEYLNAAYPSQLLQNILLGRAIYDAKNRVKTKEGFTQTIETQSVNIKYRVSANEIYFKDKKNHIIFKIKDLK